jgi:hypothetical protein
MGFLKDLAALNTMGRDIQRTTDVSAQLAHAQAAMADANATMAAMTARATSTTAVGGTPAAATVLSARQTGQFVNFAPVVELELLVPGAGGFLAPVTIREIVDQLHLARITPGVSLPVLVGEQPTDVVIDWSRS